ncbi:GGDEF domain-containing protein [Halomonas sp. HP20-15]|uniref:GGDEF domain-containing protein n=1 Tax=Halomonas sp. HP20-15 TaxID=3085901 RepID=UPI0029828588|nr:GGDEF domain-containing protein [Halomonas sp. HP20-15]MDW5375329.1 GGDEF domain-containing protein [Halomonas sp. HP20-15]
MRLLRHSTLLRLLSTFSGLFVIVGAALWLLARADSLQLGAAITENRIALLAILLLSFILIAGVLISRQYIQPLHRLVDYVKDQHDGEPIAPPASLLERHDDIAYLTREIEKLLLSLREKNQQLLEQTLNDPLTGLGNRRLLEQRLEIALPLSRRRMSPLSALMIDVDHFKLYNDHYGHPAGDDCLLEIANVLRDIFRRETDIVVRLGGEEFLVVLLDVDLSEATRLAEAMLSMLQAVGVPHETSPTAEVVTVSIGVATAAPGTPIDLDSLLTCADAALYQCKAEGRNRTVSSLVDERCAETLETTSET